MPAGWSKDREQFRGTPSQARTGPKNLGRSYAARDRCSACQSAGKTQKFVPVRSSFGESRLCLFSLLEQLYSPSHCIFRLFYRVQCCLIVLTPVPLSQGSIYVIKQSNPTYQALVYPMPTSHPCVNRLFLAADNTAGSWPTPTYALGRYQLDNNGLPMRD